MSGILVVNPIKAKLNEDLDLLTKMDPYCIFHLGSQKVKSKVCRFGGKRPSWNDSIILQRKYEPILFVELKDKDIFTDDLIGVCQVDLEKLPIKKPYSHWFPVFNNRKPAGEVLIEFVYTPDENSSSIQDRKKNTEAKVQEADKKIDIQVEDPLKKSAYLVQHIVPINKNNVQPTPTPTPTPNPADTNQRRLLYPSFNDSTPNTQQANYQQPNYQQPGYQQPNYRQPVYQQPNYQQPGVQQPLWQQIAYQQSISQQNGYQQTGYQQAGYGQPNFNQGGVWQPNVQAGVWQSNNRQSNSAQPNFGVNPYIEGTQHQLP